MASKKKKPPATWRMKDGKLVVIQTMEDPHLSNAIKMLARNGMKPGYLGDIRKDKSFIKLTGEAKRRGWIVTFLSSPLLHNGRYEYVDVWTPTPQSKLSTQMHISEWDSRLD